MNYTNFKHFKVHRHFKLCIAYLLNTS